MLIQLHAKLVHKYERIRPGREIDVMVIKQEASHTIMKGCQAGLDKFGVN